MELWETHRAWADEGYEPTEVLESTCYRTTMSDPSASPVESAFDLYNERTIIDGLFLGAIAYGVHLTLFIWCMGILIQKKRSTRDYGLMVYAILLFIMGNIGNGTNIKVGEDTFVNFRNFPGGPNAYFATGGGPVGLTCNVIYIINTWFQDVFLLYRFWMFFARFGWWWTILPNLMFLASFTLSLLLIIMLCVPGTTLWSTISINLGHSLLVNFHRSDCRRYGLTGSGAEYISLTAILVESAALYSINGIILVVSYGINSPIQNLALPVLGQTQSIAPLLIILRVFQGRAWSSTTLAMLETETDADLSGIHKMDQDELPHTDSSLQEKESF
ncbi:hypothetical protein NP233_g2016 [Leucocoprinus birnbaumii]|uniref:Uncharacterized protein n=1 Tax=Leucocoprinus birnbaumii TaxID=56174 RepID=A0AAD5YZ36_9AGAR|nr:hypothetical protein NP233_g2016 [Leucocoprinus birnbaumii]